MTRTGRMVLRRRGKPKCVSAWRIVVSVVTATTFYISWLHLLVYNARVNDRNTADYLHQQGIREVLCPGISSGTLSRQTAALASVPRNSSSALYFRTCTAEVGALLRLSHRLSLNFTCLGSQPRAENRVHHGGGGVQGGVGGGKGSGGEKGTVVGKEGGYERGDNGVAGGGGGGGENGGEKEGEKGRSHRGSNKPPSIITKEDLISSNNNNNNNNNVSQTRNNTNDHNPHHQPCDILKDFTVLDHSSVPAVPFRDPCLKGYVREHCFDDGHRVPRLVHYVWFSGHTLDAVTLLSVLAAYRFLQPCLILFHSDSLPLGPHWRALLQLVPVLVLVQREAPSVVFGRKLGVVQHKSDIARLEALKEYGGIYLDGDQIVVRNLDEFRDFPFVMGHENANNLANSLLLSTPNAKFIDVWYKNYRSYNPRQWGIHSTFLPLALAKIYPKLIHNAGYAFIKPDLPGVHAIWEGQHDWSQSHSVHLYYRSMVEGKRIRTNYTLSELTQLPSALGEISRHIVFGSKDACT